MSDSSDDEIPLTKKTVIDTKRRANVKERAVDGLQLRQKGQLKVSTIFLSSSLKFRSSIITRKGEELRMQKGYY